MNAKEIVDKAGGVYEVAEAIGVTRQAVEQWIAADRIPAERALAVAELAEMSPADIRPDIYPPRLFAA